MIVIDQPDTSMPYSVFLDLLDAWRENCHQEINLNLR